MPPEQKQQPHIAMDAHCHHVMNKLDVPTGRVLIDSGMEAYEETDVGRTISEEALSDPEESIGVRETWQPRGSNLMMRS